MEAFEPAWMNDELRLMEESVSAFFDSELVPNIPRWVEQGQVDRELWTKAGELGILGASIPEEYGGAGGQFAHDAVTYHALGKTGDFGFGFGVHNIAAHYVLSYGTEEQKQRWLPRLSSGELIGAIAMSEPSTGSDLQNVKTRADADGNGYKVNGSKIFISNGQIANFFLLVAKTDTSKGAKGVSLFGVETDDRPGFRRGRKLDKLGLKAQDTSELFFEDMPLSGGDLIGQEPGQGFYQLMQQLPWERLIIALQAVSVSEHAIKLTLDYVREREAFGKRVMDFQNTRFKLAELKTKLEVTRAFVDQCLGMQDAGKLDATRASMAKYWATEVQCEIMDECLQLHGGYGFMMEYPIAKLYADSRVQKIYGGTNEIMKELIARELDLNG